MVVTDPVALMDNSSLEHIFQRQLVTLYCHKTNHLCNLNIHFQRRLFFQEDRFPLDMEEEHHFSVDSSDLPSTPLH